MNSVNQSYIFRVTMKVRDYECDIQGVVNNANYQHYMEHARHEYLESLGKTFAELHTQGIDVMVARVEIDYKHPLYGSDSFWVGINHFQKGPYLIFEQDIYRSSDDLLIARGKIFTVALKDRTLTRGEYFTSLLSPESTPM